MDSMITIARNEDVALLAEGVDRNITSNIVQTLTKSRPPRGGRG